MFYIFNTINSFIYKNESLYVFYDNCLLSKPTPFDNKDHFT